MVHEMHVYKFPCGAGCATRTSAMMKGVRWLRRYKRESDEEKASEFVLLTAD